MTSLLKWNCLRCKNYVKGNACLAFPNGIPNDILLGYNKHLTPTPEQQNKIVFEEDEDQNA